METPIGMRWLVFFYQKTHGPSFPIFTACWVASIYTESGESPESSHPASLLHSIYTHGIPHPPPHASVKRLKLLMRRFGRFTEVGVNRLSVNRSYPISQCVDRLEAL